MIEAGVVITSAGPVYWHLPQNRTGGSLPDSRVLWDVLWEHRKDPNLGFAHSHPGTGEPSPSWTDITTFVAVEKGLGRRISWWIASGTGFIELSWTGPEKQDYRQRVVEETSWVPALRAASEYESSKFHQYVVWWLSPIDMDKEPPRSSPEYIQRQWSERYGRPGRCRLWIDAHEFPEFKGAQGAQLLDMLSAKPGILDLMDARYGGLYLHYEDLRHIQGLPGVVTDVTFQRIIPRP